MKLKDLAMLAIVSLLTVCLLLTVYHLVPPPSREKAPTPGVLSDVPHIYSPKQYSAQWRALDADSQQRVLTVTREDAEGMTTRAQVQSVVESPFRDVHFPMEQVLAAAAPALEVLLSRPDALETLESHLCLLELVTPKAAGRRQEGYEEAAHWCTRLILYLREYRQGGDPTGLVAPQTAEPPFRPVTDLTGGLPRFADLRPWEKAGDADSIHAPLNRNR